MIDIHTHILPNVDDGSDSFDETEKMLKISYSDGVRAIVATPHMFSRLGKIKDIEKYRSIFPAFKKWVEGLNINIEIFQGSENYFIAGLKEKLREFPDVLSINNGDYFLLEFPMNFIFPGTKDFIFNILNEGHIPIICHPERNTDIQANPSILYELLVAGALSQLDAGSIRGDFGSAPRESANRLLKNNMAHIIASDCHDSVLRPPGLSGMRETLSWIEKDKLELFINCIPAAIINNEGIPDIGPLKDPAQNKSFFSIFRGKNK